MKTGPKPGIGAHNRASAQPYGVGKPLYLAVKAAIREVLKSKRWRKPQRLDVDPDLLPDHAAGPPYCTRQGLLCDEDGVLLIGGVLWVPAPGEDGKAITTRTGRRC